MMLADDEVFVLEKALSEIEGLAAYLDDLMVPTVPPSGSNAGVAAQKGKSKPPAVVHILDLKDHVQAVLSGWCASLHEAIGVRVPESRRIEVRARFLRLELETIRRLDWASDCLEEVVAEARAVRDVVDPPQSRRLAVLSVDDVRAPARMRKPVSAREAAAWCRARGFAISDQTVRTWARTGVITSLDGELGAWQVFPDEVLEVYCVRQRLGRSRLRKSRAFAPRMLR